jgi:hypothetical protein
MDGAAAIAPIQAEPAPAVPASKPKARRAPLKATRHLVTECVMWAYGAGMMLWLMATIMSPVDEGAGGALGIVFAAWAAGTLPAYLVARLVARRYPEA